MRTFSKNCSLLCFLYLQSFFVRRASNRGNENKKPNLSSSVLLCELILFGFQSSHLFVTSCSSQRITAHRSCRLATMAAAVNLCPCKDGGQIFHLIFRYLHLKTYSSVAASASSIIKTGYSSEPPTTSRVLHTMGLIY